MRWVFIKSLLNFCPRLWDCVKCGIQERKQGKKESAGGFHPPKAGHLHRKPNPGLLSHGSFPNTFPAACWHSAAPMPGSTSMRSGPQISGCRCPVFPRALSHLTSVCLICELNYTCALPADCPAAVGIPARLCCGAQPAPTAW